MRGLPYFLALFSLLLLLPSAIGQQPIDKCARQCAAQDKDVNDPPVRSEGPVNVILFAHYEDLLNDAPLNTIPPDARHEPDLNGGFAVPVVHNAPAQVNLNNNLFVWTLCPGAITFEREGWLLGCMNGLRGTDLEIADGAAAVYWYMSAHAVPGQSSGGGASVGAMPLVGVDVKIDSRLIGTGKSVVFGTGDTGAQRTMMISSPGSAAVVYEFKVPLVFTQKSIPGDHLVRVKVHPYQLVAPDGSEFAQAEWRVRTGAKFPPRLILPLQAPLVPGGIEVIDQPGGTFVKAVVAGTLGSYDVDPDSATLTIEGPKPVPAEAIGAFAFMRSTAHDGTGKPAAFVWRIDESKMEGPRSAYTLKATARNLQGTFALEQEGPFEGATAKDVKGAPGVEGIALLLGLAFLAFAHRRRSP